MPQIHIHGPFLFIFLPSVSRFITSRTVSEAHYNYIGILHTAYQTDSTDMGYVNVLVDLPENLE